MDPIFGGIQIVTVDTASARAARPRDAQRRTQAPLMGATRSKRSAKNKDNASAPGATAPSAATDDAAAPAATETAAEPSMSGRDETVDVPEVVETAAPVGDAAEPSSCAAAIAATAAEDGEEPVAPVGRTRRAGTRTKPGTPADEALDADVDDVEKDLVAFALRASDDPKIKELNELLVTIEKITRDKEEGKITQDEMVKELDGHMECVPTVALNACCLLRLCAPALSPCALAAHTHALLVLCAVQVAFEPHRQLDKQPGAQADGRRRAEAPQVHVGARVQEDCQVDLQRARV